MDLATFFSDGRIDSTAGWLAAGLLGLAFGFWLERAGFGSSRKLTAVFYLRDFAVVQVMFTAIVTAALGLEALDLAGMVDRDQIYRMSTLVAPQAVGGLIFGAGFVIGGWCPGTAYVGLASGKLDALVFLLGAGLGSLAFAWAWPAIGEFATSGNRGVATLPETLGLSPAVVTLLLVLVALGMFALAARLQARFAREA